MRHSMSDTDDGQRKANQANLCGYTNNYVRCTCILHYVPIVSQNKLVFFGRHVHAFAFGGCRESSSAADPVAFDWGRTSRNIFICSKSISPYKSYLSVTRRDVQNHKTISQKNDFHWKGKGILLENLWPIFPCPAATSSICCSWIINRLLPRRWFLWGKSRSCTLHWRNLQRSPVVTSRRQRRSWQRQTL